MSFIDASDLAQVAAMVVEAADSPVDWYQMQGNFAMNADVIRSSTPVELRALVLNGILEEYNAQGYQRIRTRDYYFPGAPTIDPLDQIMLSGENSRSASTSKILRIEPLPTTGTVVATRVRTGRV